MDNTLKYFVGSDEIESNKAMLMLTNRIATVESETRHGQDVHVHMKPTIH
jgi:hypothetical protein